MEQPVSFEVVPIKYSTSVKEASTKVIAAKMVIIINHLAVMAKRNCKIYFATEQY